MSIGTPLSKSKTEIQELELLSTLCHNWRQERRNKFDSMPSSLSTHISNAITSNRYTDAEIMAAAKISHKRFAKLACREADNGQANEDLDFIPFTLIPKTTNSEKQNKLNKSTFKTAHEANNLIISTTRGDSISISG